MDKEEGKDSQLENMLIQIKGLFFEFGIKNLSMDEISRKLGISKKTLYRYVKSKEDLIEKMFEYEIKSSEVIFKLIGESNVNAIETLFKVSLSVYQEMKRFNPMLMFELRKYYNTLFEAYHARKFVQISKLMRLNLIQGIKEGIYREDVNLDAVVALYMNYMIEIHRSDRFEIVNVSYDELFSVMFENHIRAIATVEGVEYFEKRKNEISERDKNINNE